VVSALLGVQLGALIEIAVFDKAGKAIWAAFERGAQSPAEHAVVASWAWNNVGYRARAAGEHREVFSGLFGDEPAASPERRYQQSNHFFGFATNAVAAAESLTFAVYVVQLGKRDIPLTERNLKVTRADQIKAIKSSPLFLALGEMLEERLAKVGDWWQMRDVLMHRGQPARNHYVGGPKHSKSMLARNPKATPDKWNNEFEFNAKSCDDFSHWLSELIGEAAPLLEKAVT